jgi:GNAT superfamily N-acetyltransferase
MSSVDPLAMSPAAPVVRVRRATDRDAELLARLGAETFSETFGPDNTPQDMAAYLTASFSPEIQAAELADASSVFLLAEAGEIAAGYVRLREGPAPPAITGSRPIEIVRFYARAPWIGRGLGAILMEACLREAERRGCGTLWLDVWEKNPRARRFYRKWGFVEVGTQPFQLGDDIQTDLLMQRPVGKGEPPRAD